MSFDQRKERALAEAVALLTTSRKPGSSGGPTRVDGLAMSTFRPSEGWATERCMVGPSRRIRHETRSNMNTHILSATILMLTIGTASSAPASCSGPENDEICLLSFGDLWGSREAYAGRKIVLSGYLVSGFGRLILYPGKDYFTFQRASGGVAVEVEAGVFRAARSRMKRRDDDDWEYDLPCPVMVMGTYSDKPSGEPGSLGVIASNASGLSIPVYLEPCSQPMPLSLSLDKE